MISGSLPSPNQTFVVEQFCAKVVIRETVKCPRSGNIFNSSNSEPLSFHCLVVITINGNERLIRYFESSARDLIFKRSFRY